MRVTIISWQWHHRCASDKNIMAMTSWHHRCESDNNIMAMTLCFKQRNHLLHKFLLSSPYSSIWSSEHLKYEILKKEEMSWSYQHLLVIVEIGKTLSKKYFLSLIIIFNAITQKQMNGILIHTKPFHPEFCQLLQFFVSFLSSHLIQCVV